jgi:peptide/nickel transport system permease protein
VFITDGFQMYDYRRAGHHPEVGEGVTPARGSPAAGGAPHVMLVYIVRRLFAAVILLLIVTAATFLIFFVLPRLGGAHGRRPRLALRRQERQRGGHPRDRGEAGFTDPIWVQYGRFVGALFVGADYSTGPTTVHCPAPCLGYSFITRTRCCPTCSTGCRSRCRSRRAPRCCGWWAG